MALPGDLGWVWVVSYDCLILVLCCLSLLPVVFRVVFFAHWADTLSYDIKPSQSKMFFVNDVTRLSAVCN